MDGWVGGWTDKQTYYRQPGIFELTLIHKGNFNFFAYGRERMSRVKFIPPCSARRGINYTIKVFKLPQPKIP
jgi:hypothetical protein